VADPEAGAFLSHNPRECPISCSQPPAQEYIKPVRVCIKCKKLCWKAEAIVAAINANDVAAMQVIFSFSLATVALSSLVHAVVISFCARGGTHFFNACNISAACCNPDFFPAALR
jgi:hypothetical protein